MHHIGKTKIVRYPLSTLVLENAKGEEIITLNSLGEMHKGEAFTTTEDACIAFWNHIAGVNPLRLQEEKEILESQVKRFLDGEITLKQLKLINEEF